MLPKEILRLRFDLLQSYRTLILRRSFSKAAQDLDLSQGTVSQHLKELERTFGGIILVNRTSKSFELTPEGELLYEAAEKILDILEKTRFEIMRINGSRKKLLKIASSSIPGMYLLPDIIMQFRKKHPEIEFDVDITNSEDAINKLNAGEVTFAAVGGIFGENTDKYEIKEIGHDVIEILLRKGHPFLEWLEKNEPFITREQFLEKLTRYPWIFRERGSATREWFIEKWPSMFPIEIALEFHDNIAIINALRKSNALSALSSLIIEHNGISGEIVPLRHMYLPTIKRRFCFIRRKDTELKEWERAIWSSIPKVE